MALGMTELDVAFTFAQIVSQTDNGDNYPNFTQSQRLRSSVHEHCQTENATHGT